MNNEEILWERPLQHKTFRGSTFFWNILTLPFTMQCPLLRFVMVMPDYRKRIRGKKLAVIVTLEFTWTYASSAANADISELKTMDGRNLFISIMNTSSQHLPFHSLARTFFFIVNKFVKEILGMNKNCGKSIYEWICKCWSKYSRPSTVHL